LASDFDPTAAGVAALCTRIKAQGHATVDGDFIPGLVALAAPILDWQGEAQAAVTLIGTDAAVLESASDAVRRLIGFCQDHSFASILGQADG